ncbi:hypothetical protein ABFX02_04G180400 [Erythranthe guttata]
MGTLSRCDSRNGFQLVGHLSDPRFTNNVNNMPGILSQNQIVVNDDNAAAPLECDYFNGVYEYINQMLMDEDDLDHRPCMFQDCSALQAAEKYFHDALSDTANSPPPPPPPAAPAAAPFYSPDLILSASDFPSWTLFESDVVSGAGQGQWNATTGGPSPPESRFHQLLNSGVVVNHGGGYLFQGGGESFQKHVQVFAGEGRSGKEKTHRSEYSGEDSQRSGKQLASYEAEDPAEVQKYDKSLLCPKMNPEFYNKTPPRGSDEKSDSDEENKKQYRKTKEVKRGRPKGSKKNRAVTEVVDLSSLLTRCAEAVANFNLAAGETLLKQIRSHCSPHGDANERLAHCFANALEARMAGTGAALYTAFASRRIQASELLKSYQAYVTSCPFKRMSNIFANKSIGKYTKDAAKIHIVDFGILYGFQWPCIIQGLSLRPGGPPVLRITGVDYPQPGFKPAERIEQTGRRLVSYCKRFNVPFLYNAIAKKWDEVTVEDLKIEKDEMLVVNCMYRLRHVPDESSVGVGGANAPPSPRDSVLKLIRRIKPDLFVHGVVNGSYNAPFFATRFREALFHYSSFFDMMEATLPRDDRDRMLYEREVFGRDVMNVVACEGSERIERPETYKQWTVRNQRAGFVQMPLYREIVKEVKIKIRQDYHSDFMLDEDGEWLLQGWKGRVMYALSCWRPNSQEST